MAAFYKLILMSYSWNLQNDMQSIMLFTATLTYKSVCKTYLIVSDSQDKSKDTVAVSVDFIYNHFDNPRAVHDIIWSDALLSEFQNKFIVKFLQSFRQT